MAGHLGARGLYIVVDLGQPAAQRSQSAPPLMKPATKAETDEEDFVQPGVPNREQVQEYLRALEERADLLDFTRQPLP